MSYRLNVKKGSGHLLKCLTVIKCDRILLKVPVCIFKYCAGLSVIIFSIYIQDFLYNLCLAGYLIETVVFSSDRHRRQRQGSHGRRDDAYSSGRSSPQHRREESVDRYQSRDESSSWRHHRRKHKHHRRHHRQRTNTSESRVSTCLSNHFTLMKIIYSHYQLKNCDLRRNIACR